MKMMNRIFAPLLYSLIFNILGNNLAIAQNDLSDPTIGTWELNQAESTNSENAPLPNWIKRTEIYRIIDNGMIEMESSSVLSEGTSGSGKASWDAKGGIVRDSESEIIIESRISKRQWLVTKLVNGIQSSSRLKVISEDGKQMFQTFRAFDNQNKTYEKHSDKV